MKISTNIGRLLAGAAAAAVVNTAQTQTPPPVPQNDPPVRIPNDKLPPALLLGRRIEQVRLAASLCPVVVIVTDAQSYIEAIEAWTPTRRFPVLIDDGSFDSREDIARFVRSYQPTKVVRWKAPASTDQGFGPVKPDRFYGAVAKSWGVTAEKPDQAAIIEQWKKISHDPPGIVAASTDDTAWTAALALCAGRGQPVVFVKSSKGIDSSMTPAESDALAAALAGAADATGYTWRATGDTIEAITLCVNVPARLEKGGNEHLSVTDRVGRHGSGVSAAERWAWCGQIFGSAAPAAYRAMCALFLSPRGAWIFDSYSDAPPWSTFDGTSAGALLKEAGMAIEVLDKPRQSARDWRLRAARPVEADLILVNSSGNSDFFNLEPGQCKPADVPMLTRPAALHFVHSWSLLFPGNRDTVGGRWLARGVFAYYGSVNEPFLNAFVPTPKVAGRLVAGAPFAAAVRHDNGHLWKLAVFGDPLYTLGPAAPRVSEEPLLPGAQDVNEKLRELLKGSSFAEAIGILAITGRDEDAAKVAQAVMREKPEAMTAELARVSVMPLMRTGNNRGVVNACLRFPNAKAEEPTIRDALWLSAYPLMESPDEQLLTVLKANLRTDLIGRDAAELARAWGKARGVESANAMLIDVRAGLTDRDQREAFDKAVRENPVR